MRNQNHIHWRLISDETVSFGGFVLVNKSIQCLQFFPNVFFIFFRPLLRQKFFLAFLEKVQAILTVAAF